MISNHFGKTSEIVSSKRLEHIIFSLFHRLLRWAVGLQQDIETKHFRELTLLIDYDLPIVLPPVKYKFTVQPFLVAIKYPHWLQRRQLLL
jgi:hypothetical protein